MAQEGAAILFVGAFTLDVLYTTTNFSNGPGKYLASSRISTASGMATTAATAAARLGAKAALWASVGEDVTGHALIKEIEAEGVDCRPVRVVTGGRTATAAIIVDGQGERWVVVDYDPLTQSPPAPDTLPDLDCYQAVMADVRWPEASEYALKNLRGRGRLAVLDMDVAERGILEKLAPHASHIVASAIGAEILTGQADITSAACLIARNYGCFVCVTNGGEGAVWVAPDRLEPHHVPSPKVEVRDTNGAGDVFHAAFTLALAEGQAEAYAVQFAHAAAALKCTVVGGRLGAPDRQATVKLMKETY
ncbi:MAG: PfkB family carbohydrate kinase [Candidatus Puniceispirillaceae bacterium]